MDLIGDIGGTYARFALADETAYVSYWQVQRSLFLTFQDAIQVYLEKMGNITVKRAAFAWAAPVANRNIVHLGWAPYWITPVDQLRADLGFEQLTMVNDLAAIAQAIPFLPATELEALNNIPRSSSGCRIIVSPGTAFGAALSIWDGVHWKHMASDIGYSQSPFPASERERLIMEDIRIQVGVLTISNLICGLGLRFIYEALCKLDGNCPATSPAPFDIIDAAIADNDPVASEAVQMFLSLLLRVTEGLCLSFHATGGIYLAGAICRRMKPLLTDIDTISSKFLQQFSISLILHEQPAFIGLQKILVQS